MAELSRQIEVMYKLGYECRNCGCTFFREYPLVLFRLKETKYIAEPLNDVNLIIMRGNAVWAHQCENLNRPIGVGDLTSAEAIKDAKS